MERLLPSTSLPFEVGALYNRREQIHGLLGGQRQGGISTPATSPYVILFTGEAGKQHGYHDFWDEENVLHYYGEGQRGDMTFSGGNLAIREHLRSGKRLLLFQMMGHGRPYRFLGEFQFLSTYQQVGVPDTNGMPRKALVFKLQPLESAFEPFQRSITDAAAPEIELAATANSQIMEVRTKQSLFKRRLLIVEKECRLTRIADLRFLRASHIKPWSKCASGDERVDGNNGLLLSPTADHLFDRGWITFEDNGALVRSQHLPSDVISRIGIDLGQGRKCGSFSTNQKTYLEYHRNAVFENAFKKLTDPLLDLLTTSRG
ncbi:MULTISPECIES: HNH endonuclease [Lysobacterales]|uniref:HNH endonuclease n=1 Tax=Lysobacterales TaxID=135614 RepID=UPI0012EBC86B|nr:MULTISPECIES: HNH endonuclease signature motif containing protein [Xanthomonadales]HET9032049.1 HNH endonuclease signature motif containing protein [Dokdonella sp.]